MVTDLKLPQVLFQGCGQHCSQCRLLTSTTAWDRRQGETQSFSGKEQTTFFRIHISTSQGKEASSGDISLHLNATNYLLCFGALAKHLTFKRTGDDTFPGNLKASFTLTCTRARQSNVHLQASQPPEARLVQ